jgi:protein-S-isoprenylcysteine O-methyltransferase Ste14
VQFWTAIDVVNPVCSTFVFERGIEAKGGNMRYVLINGLAILSVLAVATETALAAIAVPGPIVGAGAPALLVVAGAYWLVRHMRKRGK